VVVSRAYSLHNLNISLLHLIGAGGPTIVTCQALLVIISGSVACHECVP
jgi:hypothetical protein